MESVLGRHRNLIIFLGVLFLQVLGLAVQVKRSDDAEHTRLIRVWAVDAITPLERAFVRLQDGANDLWHNYFFLRGVRAENRQLKDQIEKMRLDQVRLSEDAAQARRLQVLLNFKEQMIGKPVAAQVIGSGGSDSSRIIYIDKGKNEGIDLDMAVITVDGIVGKVLVAYPSVSQVLLINDQSSGVGVLLAKSRLQGVLRGTPDGELMLERVMSDEQVSPGETVLSSGGDQIFPKGLPVGTVTHVSPGRELFLNIKVKPAADLSRLEEVLVVTEKRERESVADSGAKVRAADILAQRLPSVPDKPPATDPSQAAKPQISAEANHATASVGAKPQVVGVGGVKPLTPNVVKSAAMPAASSTTAASQNSANPESPTRKPAVLNIPKNSSAAAAPTKATGSSGQSRTPSSSGRGANGQSIDHQSVDRQSVDSSDTRGSLPKTAAKIPQPKPSAAPPSPQSPDNADTPH